MRFGGRHALTRTPAEATRKSDDGPTQVVVSSRLFFFSHAATPQYLLPKETRINSSFFCGLKRISCCLFFPLETKGMISFSLPLAMLPHRYDSFFDAVHNFSPITNFNRYECKKYKRKCTHGREDGGIGSLAYDAAACCCPASWSRLFPASGFDIIKTAIDSTTTAHISSTCLPSNEIILFLALFPFL